MSTALLTTKLYVPPARPEWVPRPHLIERLSAGLDARKLTLVSAPAGSGKTSLILRTIEGLQGAVKLGVIEADIDSKVDAEKVAAAGIPAVHIRKDPAAQCFTIEADLKK